jgi:D-alanine-D-alanine ligase
MTRVLVLGGGPDAERPVSLVSSQAVADALALEPRFHVNYRVIDRPELDDIRGMSGDVIFPVLHGAFGEGGPLQDLLVTDGRPFVGCKSVAARTAMDKMATKLAAAKIGIDTADAAMFNPSDAGCPLMFPVVVKPVHEGSSVGVHFASDAASWSKVHAAVVADMKAHPARLYMVEAAIMGGRELTVGLLDGVALAPIEIKPQEKFYDYHAKYHSDDTRYEVEPTLPSGVRDAIRKSAERLFAAIGCRHLSRADFILDSSSKPWLLEINTMPGFTGHSLLPMAANHAGFDFRALTTRLIDLALRDGVS